MQQVAQGWLVLTLTGAPIEGDASGTETGSAIPTVPTTDERFAARAA